MFDPEHYIEKIEKNWGTFEALCGKLEDDGLRGLIESLENRLSICPASTHLDRHGAYPGGLIDHTLKVTSNVRKLVRAYDVSFPISSVLKVALLHDIGKVGDLEHDLFIDQDSSWHREKLGQYYKYNENLSKMSSTHRTLYLLQHFGVKLTMDEWIAIQISGGSHIEENRFYVGSEPTLALILQQAKIMAVHQEKLSQE